MAVSHCPGATRPIVQMVRICTSHSLTVSASTALLGGTRTVVCSVYLFRHICVCPRWGTSLRGARGPVPHERGDLSALIVGCIVRAACCGGGVKRWKAPRPAMAQEVNAINERTAKAFTPLRLYSLMIAMP